MEETPSKDLRYKLRIRVYGQGIDTSTSHGYCVDDMPFGVSAPIGEIYLDVRNVSFKRLRSIIEYNNSGQMNKRSLIFQEALFIMSRLPNYYSRPNDKLTAYFFAFSRRDGNEIKLISPNVESEAICSQIKITDIFQNDLVLVPLSQIPPDLEQNLYSQVKLASEDSFNKNFEKQRSRARKSIENAINNGVA